MRNKSISFKFATRTRIELVIEEVIWFDEMQFVSGIEMSGLH